MIEIIDKVIDGVLTIELIICVTLLAWYLITGGPRSE